MKVNGEGIYGSRGWIKLGEGPGGKVRSTPSGAIGRSRQCSVAGRKISVSRREGWLGVRVLHGHTSSGSKK